MDWLKPELLKDVPVPQGEAEAFFANELKRHKEEGTNCYETLKAYACWTQYSGAGMDLPVADYRIKETTFEATKRD